MKNSKKFLKPKDSFEKILLIFSICMVIGLYWRWLLPGAITWGDWFYFTKSSIYNFGPGLWNTRDGLGSYVVSSVPIYPIQMLQVFLCRTFNFDYSMIERLVIYMPLVFFPIFSSWYLARVLGFGRMATAAMILVFNLNSVAFFNSNVPLLALSDAMAPLIFALFIRAVRHPDVRRALLFGLLLALQMVIEIRSCYITLFFCSLYFVYSIVIEPQIRYDLRRVSKTLLLSAMVVILLQSYWIIPLLFGKMSGTAPVLLPEAYKSASGLTSLSYFTLLHSLGLHVPMWGKSGVMNPVNPQFLLLPMIAFSILLFGRQKRKIFFFVASALIFSFLVKGSKPPFGGINIWLFLHFPGFFMFRTPGKWYMPLTLSYAVLVGYLIDQVITREFINNAFVNLKRRFNLAPFIIKTGMFISVVAVIFIVFPVQPISTLRYSSACFEPRPVPEESSHLEVFIHSQKEFFRILWLPMLYRFGHFSTQHPAIMGYSLGQERLPSLLTGNPRYWSYAFSYLGKSFSSRVLRLFSIKYIIVPSVPADSPNEIHYWFTLPPQYYRQLAEKTPGLQPVSFKGKSQLYEVPDPLPHLYTSTIPTFIVGNLEALIPLAYTRYLDDQPIFFFDEQQEGKSLERLLPRISTVIFNNSSPSDLALQILKPNYGVRIENRENPVIFKAEKDGVYQIYSKDEKLKQNQKLAIGTKKLELRAESREQILQWRKIGEIELEKGEHRVTVEKTPQELVIVPEEKIIRTKEKVLNYLKKTKIPPTCFFSKELSGEIDSWEKRSLKGSFYIPSSGTYSLRTKVSPQYVTAPDYGLKERIGRHLRKRSFVPKNVKYFISTRKDILTVNTYLDGDAKEKESLYLKKKIRPVDLEKYPNFEIDYRLANPDMQRVMIISGIDLNNDGKIDARISEELSSGSEKEFNTYDFNLYKKVGDSLGQDLPSDTSFHLVKVYLKVSKKDGLDCSTSPNKGWYKTSFGNFGLYGLSEDKCVKNRNYAFNKRIGLIKKIKRGKNKIILSRFFEDLDLEKYPYISLIHQNEDPQSLSVSIILNLDFNHDGKSDGKVTYEGVTAEHPLFDAYQLARAKFPDKNLYHLVKLEIRASRASVFSPGAVSEEPPFSLSLRHLQIYNEEIIPHEEAYLTSPTLKIDQKRLSIAKSGSWYTTSPVYLKEGHHILDALFPGIETKLDFIAIEPVSRIKDPGSRIEPKIIFQSINPTKYRVKVKNAKEPFWLVFSESFHEEWKAYVRQLPVTSNQLPVEWPVLVSAWKDRGKRIEIKEHFMVNGYANGWWIDPSKVQSPKSKVKEMEIVVEFVPQRLFEVGVLISGLTLLGCVGYLTIGGVRRRKRRAGEQVRKWESEK